MKTNYSKIQKVAGLALHPYANKCLLVGIVFCLFAYVYLANSAVRSVTLLEESRSRVESLSAVVSELESKNLTLVNRISMERARSLGLNQTDQTLFLVKGKKTESLSLNRP